jgi:hypothetical protein
MEFCTLLDLSLLSLMLLFIAVYFLRLDWDRITQRIKHPVILGTYRKRDVLMSDTKVMSLYVLPYLCSVSA